MPPTPILPAAAGQCVLYPDGQNLLIVDDETADAGVGMIRVFAHARSIDATKLPPSIAPLSAWRWRAAPLLDDLCVGDTAIRIAGVGGYAENGEAYEKLRKWLVSPDVSARIAAILESARETDPDRAERIDGVLAGLRRLR